jgi:glycosyltransferase involved in cell wall biosynthesis
MRVLVVSDAWEPQVNGVVRTLQAMRRELTAMGHEVVMLTPDLYYSIPCPTYPEIRLAMAWPSSIGERIAEMAPDAIHLATEGPLCLAARRYCLAHGLSFTTAYHTQFPDYVERRTGIPASAVWQYIKWFHHPAAGVLASTPSIRQELAAHGIGPLVPWGRGVDQSLFAAGAEPLAAMAALPGPVMLYVGRVAVEKNIEAFLQVEHPGTRVVVGDGPARAELQARYPDAVFLGKLEGEALAAAYAAADVFVFPSRTDTFGLVIIEALASGVPVAAYPVTGPRDLVVPGVGALDEDLDAAIARALLCDRAACAAYGAGFTWRASAEQFLAALVPAQGQRALAA